MITYSVVFTKPVAKMCIKKPYISLWVLKLYSDDTVKFLIILHLA